MTLAASLLACPALRKSRAADAIGEVSAMRRVAPAVAVPGTIAWNEFAPGQVRRTMAGERGHAVLLNVWATWCGPCVLEMPALAALAPRAAAAGIMVRPVSIDLTGADAVRAFYARAKIMGLPVLVDADGSVRRGFGVAAVPVSFLIGPDGMLRARLDAAADWGAPDTVQRLRSFL